MSSRISWGMWMISICLLHGFSFKEIFYFLQFPVFEDYYQVKATSLFTLHAPWDHLKHFVILVISNLLWDTTVIKLTIAAKTTNPFAQFSRLSQSNQSKIHTCIMHIHVIGPFSARVRNSNTHINNPTTGYPTRVCSIFSYLVDEKVYKHIQLQKQSDKAP
jgi:hypothetical protein